jgi:hypothetical protein
MVPPNWVGQSWTREIAASRIAAVSDLGDLRLVGYHMKTSALRTAAILVLGYFWLGLLVEFEGKVKGKGPAEAEAQG